MSVRVRCQVISRSTRSIGRVGPKRLPYEIPWTRKPLLAGQSAGSCDRVNQVPASTFKRRPWRSLWEMPIPDEWALHTA